MSAYDGPWTYAGIKEALDKARTHEAVTALNDSINDRLWAERHQLILTDAQSRVLTLLVAKKVAQFEYQSEGVTRMEQKEAKRDYRRELTDKIIRALEAGTAPWQKPWDGSVAQPMMPYNPISGTVYRGGNVIGLMMQGYDDPRWCTYKQAQEQGWQVRRGEKSTTVEYWKFDDVIETKDEETGEIKKQRVMLERPRVFYASVFNASQMDNVPEIERTRDGYDWEPMEMAEQILQGAKVPLYHDQQDRAFYSVARDEMHMPPREAFSDAMRYYSTALHELGHATGHPSRLNRQLGNTFGSVEYAQEELRAELASFFLASQLGVPHDVGQHAAYVESWIKVLAKDKNELFRAARDAEQITEYLMDIARGQKQEQVKDKRLEPPAIVAAHEQFVANLKKRFGDQEIPSMDMRIVYARNDFFKETYGVDAGRMAYNRRGEELGAPALPFRGPIVHAAGGHYYQLDEVDNIIIRHYEDGLGQPLEIGKNYTIENTGGVRSIVHENTHVNVAEKASRTVFPTSENDAREPETSAAPRRVYINVPFAEKEQAKGLGAKWDKERRSWYVPEDLGVEAAERNFKKWMDVPKELSRSDVERQFRDALAAAGLVLIDDALDMDGEWHRTRVSTSSKTKALKGAYIVNYDNLQQNEFPNGYIQNFDTGYKGAWFPDGLILTDDQRRQYERQSAENRATRERELAETQERVAARCAKKWASLPEVSTHPYLERKGVEAFGVRQQGDNLVTPVQDADGKIWSLQYISTDPEKIKLYEKGGQKTGNFHVLGRLDGAETVLFAEGYATCASLHMATQLPVVEVFDSGNIDAVLRALRPRLENVEKIICADDDMVTTAKTVKALNNATIRERFGLVEGIGAAEIETTLESCEQVTLQANPQCTLKLSYRFPQEHGGFRRVVGEIVNTETNDRLPILINNVGREKAWEAGQKHEAKVVVPVFATMEAYEVRGRTDFNDLHQDEGLDKVQAQVAAVIDLGRTKGVAVEAAKASIGEAVKVTDPRDNQRYVGPVVANAGLHAVQDVGRLTAVAHPIDKLDRMPVVGATARIEYEQGRGKVMEAPARQTRTNER